MRLHPVSYGLQIKSVTLVACQQPGFGGAIDVAQRYTHGMEHAKHIWCHGGTTAAGTAQPGQAEQISQRAQNQCIGDRKQQPVQQANGFSIQAPHIDGVTDLHAPLVDTSSNGSCVEHVRLHRGRHAFPLARSKCHTFHCQFPNVGQHLLRALREVHYHGQSQSHGDAIYLFSGPGWRDVTQVFHTRLHIHGIDQALGVVDQKAMREDHALGLPRRAGSVRKNRYVIGGSRIH